MTTTAAGSMIMVTSSSTASPTTQTVSESPTNENTSTIGDSTTNATSQSMTATSSTASTVTNTTTNVNRPTPSESETVRTAQITPVVASTDNGEEALEVHKLAGVLGSPWRLERTCTVIYRTSIVQKIIDLYMIERHCVSINIIKLIRFVTCFNDIIIIGCTTYLGNFTPVHWPSYHG